MFFKNKFLSKRLILFIDLVTVLCSSIGAYALVLLFYTNLRVFLPEIQWCAAISVIASAISFIAFKTFNGIIRYSTIYEIQKLLFSLVVSHILIFVSIYWGLGDVSGSITVAYCTASFLISSVTLVGFRFLIVFIYSHYAQELGPRNVSIFIFGISPESVSLAQTIKMSNGKYRIAGFISTNFEANTKKVLNCPIIYIDSKNLLKLLKYKTKSVLFPNEKALLDNKGLVDNLLAIKIKPYVVPQYEAAESVGEPIYKQIRSVQIEDLLGREEIDISMDLISSSIKGKTVLVTGAAGSIGSEIVRQVAKFDPKLVVCFDIAETPLNDLDLELKARFPNLNFKAVIGDVRNSERLDMVFTRNKPDIIYHAAAYKHVPMMENNPCEAIMTNVYGTKLVADFAVKNAVEMFIMISTDKAVNPTNIMGASKRIAEIYIQTLAAREDVKQKNMKLVTTRFGNVLGSNGSVIPLFKRQIESGGPLTVTDENITRYFMTIPEACRLVLEASAIGKTGHIYVFDMGEPVKIMDLAKRMIELAGLRLGRDIDIKVTGLRPGEKLYEELLNDSETVIPTEHEKILIAKVREYSYDDILPQIEKMILLSRQVEIEETVVEMKELVPEFVSKNSYFAKLDKDKSKAVILD
ncbi:nucleoside-diphosphate sugar epimerase/dehydratase [Dysgonomonas sp. PH5-37]|uniref:UDP-N-acetylglucosamine 4,6-dehydratase family protein n=1 Tax=Dysgonomonas sp. PH5-37 TaxID=2940648 RepID=UPI002476FF8D|nr:nucleoside-diphosphate sugar epimerase/dehydratase [Dysgonomonas sp. PH5-37]